MKKKYFKWHRRLTGYLKSSDALIPELGGYSGVVHDELTREEKEGWRPGKGAARDSGRRFRKTTNSHEGAGQEKRCSPRSGKRTQDPPVERLVRVHPNL